MEKKNILSLFSLALLMFVMSEGYSQDYKGRFSLPGTFTSTTNYERLESGDIKFTIQQLDDASNTAEFTLSQLKLSSFIDIFTYKMKSLYPDGHSFSKSDEDQIKQFAKEQFFQVSLESLLEAEDDAPVIGKLKISDSVTLRQGSNSDNKCSKKCDSCKNEKSCYYDMGKITIEDVEIEFMDGFIETIKVKGKANEKATPGTFRFENKYGIGFSTRGNYKKFDEIALFDAIQNDSNYFINLGELLDYDYFIRQSNKDYSPKNEVYRTFGGKEIELKKEENSKLFEFIVFSDFMGIENENPNGLVQAEFAKKIVLRTSRKQVINGGVGTFQYIKPTFQISKIEENNRFLFPEKVSRIYSDSLSGNVLINSLKTSPLDILNYQRLSLGLDLNFLFIDSPESKIHFLIDLGFKFGRTLVRDSISALDEDGKATNTGLINEFGVNHFTAYPIFRMQFFPDERFGLMLSTQYQYFIPAFSNPGLMTYSKDAVADSDYRRWVGSHEIQGFWKPSSLKGTVFVRWRFNHQIGNITNNFHQLQTGISFNITNSK